MWAPSPECLFKSENLCRGDCWKNLKALLTSMFSRRRLLPSLTTIGPRCCGAIFYSLNLVKSWCLTSALIQGRTLSTSHRHQCCSELTRRRCESSSAEIWHTFCSRAASWSHANSITLACRSRTAERGKFWGRKETRSSLKIKQQTERNLLFDLCCQWNCFIRLNLSVKWLISLNVCVWIKAC